MEVEDLGCHLLVRVSCFVSILLEYYFTLCGNKYLYNMQNVQIMRNRSSSVSPKKLMHPRKSLLHKSITKRPYSSITQVCYCPSCILLYQYWLWA